jgi:hypothetical protein
MTRTMLRTTLNARHTLEAVPRVSSLLHRVLECAGSGRYFAVRYPCNPTHRVAVPWVTTGVSPRVDANDSSRMIAAQVAFAATRRFETSMSPSRRAIPAKKVASDFGLDLSFFIDEVLALASGLPSDREFVTPAEMRRETCGMLWAIILLSLDASALASDETEVLSSLLFACLAPVWRKHWSGVDELQLRARAQKYLNQKDARSQVKTASKIAASFFDTVHVAEEGRQRLARQLAALLGHRMLSDVHRLNEVKMNFRIQLSLATALLSSAYLCGGEAALRLLRIL